MRKLCEVFFSLFISLLISLGYTKTINSDISQDNKKKSDTANEAQEQTVNDVTLYADTNYQGESWVLQPRGYSISELKTFKSLKIPSGYEVLFSDRKDYESNNNKSYSQDISTIDTSKYKYIYIAKLDDSTVTGIATREEYNSNTHEYVGVGLNNLKILDPAVENIIIDNSPLFNGLGNITQYRNLQSIKYNASSSVVNEVFQKDMNSIFEFLDKINYLKNIEIAGTHEEFSITRNKKFLGVNIQSLSAIPADTTEIYLIDCNKIQDFSTLSRYTSLKKLFMYGTTFSTATTSNWNEILSIIDILSISGSLTHVQLPETYNGKLVKSANTTGRKLEYYGALGAIKIANSGFEYSTKLKEVYFPSVKSIDDLAFHRCISLTTVDMPQCESIGQKAFYCDENLQNARFTKVKKVGNHAFYQCKRLAVVDMANVTDIGISAFETCAALKKFGDLSQIKGDNVFFAPTITKVEDYAFRMTDASGQTKIEAVEMPECISIGKESFSRWRSMKKLNLPKCKTIDVEGFYDPYSLEELNLPLVETIATRAFVFNKGECLRGTLELPHVKTIGSCAFGGTNWAHPNITAVNAPECTNMSNDAFRGNINLKSIYSSCNNKIIVMQQARSRLT